MFTGLVREIGRIRSLEPRGGDVRVAVEYGSIARDRLTLGASIAVDGVCLTVVALEGGCFIADVSGETLRVTTLAAKTPGARVNLEPSLRVGDELGGHWVSGHVDGVATVLSATEDARSRRFELAAPAALARYIARKGSVTLDGVSLTVNEVAGTNFFINLIPHTLEVTTLGALRAGTRVNLEIDVLARYVERLSTADSTANSMAGSAPDSTAGYSPDSTAGYSPDPTAGSAPGEHS